MVSSERTMALRRRSTLLAIHQRSDGSGAIDVPPSILLAVACRLETLSSAGRELLALAAFFGRELGVDVLTRAAGIEPNEVLALLDQAASARIVTEVPGERGRYASQKRALRPVRKARDRRAGGDPDRRAAAERGGAGSSGGAARPLQPGPGRRGSSSSPDGRRPVPGDRAGARAAGGRRAGPNELAGGSSDVDRGRLAPGYERIGGAGVPTGRRLLDHLLRGRNGPSSRREGTGPPRPPAAPSGTRGPRDRADRPQLLARGSRRDRAGPRGSDKGDHDCPRADKRLSSGARRSPRRDHSARLPLQLHAGSRRLGAVARVRVAPRPDRPHAMGTDHGTRAIGRNPAQHDDGASGFSRKRRAPVSTADEIRRWRSVTRRRPRPSRAARARRPRSC